MSEMPTMTDPRRALPAMDALLNHDATSALVARYGQTPVRDALRHVLNDLRQNLAQTHQQPSPPTPADIIHGAQTYLQARYAPTLHPVINATGVIIHTNLGRAPLSQQARQALEAIARDYNTLEFERETGKRGSRYVHAENLLCQVTGAPAALVVNNNAAALVLLLAELARGRQVIISRGQLVEIGGGFRIPDIMMQSGAHLVEVGTTNRTRLSDYAQAITPDTALLLRVHSSNFKQIGFVEQPELDELAHLAHQRDCLLVDDIGSGALLDTTPFGLAPEPTVQASLKAGADIVCFSGDKLLGGPQAGILVGRADLIQRLKAHPFARAMRADKLCYAALNATLEHYIRDEALTHIPIWRMISTSPDALLRRAQVWRDQLAQLNICASVQADESAVGGGSLPGATLPTHTLALDVPQPDAFLTHLRHASPSIIARIANGQVRFDPRTVHPEDDNTLINTLYQQLMTHNQNLKDDS